ncbi:MAG: galactose ABC transporter substrate-binding protein [Deltaproteobacteria bacterium]|jgi:methyl-galactoside transport system substrate-binding protein|nr:galactose ABC transporter substrate-binding protein [Deltaproteobacteria bacterium]
MIKMLKFILSAVLPALLLLPAACDDNARQEETVAGQGEARGKPLLGILLYREDDAYITLVRNQLETALAGQAELVVLCSNFDQLTQNEQIEDLLRRKVDALIINLVDPQSASIALDMAKKEEVPVIFFNREPDLSSLENYAGKTCFVGTVPDDAGKLQGDIIAQLWKEHPEYDRNGDGKFQFVMFQGDPDNPEAVARTEYSISQAVAEGVNMEQLGENYMCAWDDKLAKTSMNLALAAHGGKIEIVVSNNDSMALGAIAALNEIGFNTGLAGADFMPVVGVDAVPQAIEAIKEGRMSATVVQDAGRMAGAIAALAMNAVRKADFLAGTGYKWDASGFAVRIPYAPYVGDN